MGWQRFSPSFHWAPSDCDSDKDGDEQDIIDGGGHVGGRGGRQEKENERCSKSTEPIAVCWIEGLKSHELDGNYRTTLGSGCAGKYPSPANNLTFLQS